MDEFSKNKKLKELSIDIRRLFYENKYSIVIRMSNKYLKINSKDLYVRFFQALSYRNLGMIENARLCLEEIIELSESDNMKITNNCVIESLYYVYYQLGMYKEALDLIPRLRANHIKDIHSLMVSETVIRQALGLPIELNKRFLNNYTLSQVVSYDEEKAKSRFKNYNGMSNQDKAEYPHFNKKMDLDYLFEILKLNINENNKSLVGDKLEVHYFELPNSGEYKDIICNYIKVFVIPKTNQIIKAYPTYRIDYTKSLTIDYTHEKLFPTKDEKVKTYSQIDRFNKKYKRAN